MPKEFKRNGFVTRETGCFHEHIILLERPFLDDVYCPLDLRLWAAQSTVDVLVNKVLLNIQAHILIFSWIVP